MNKQYPINKLIKSKTLKISKNGNYPIIHEKSVEVDVPGPPNTFKPFISNTYNPVQLFANSNLVSLDKFLRYTDTSGAISTKGMFSGCVNLQTIPLLDTSKVTDMSSMFYGCSNLETIPALDMSLTTVANLMFSNCTNLTYVPKLNTKKLANASSMFYNCVNLHTVEELDFSNYNGGDVFTNCTSLTNVYIKNIKTSLTLNSESLSDKSLIDLCKECIKSEYSMSFNFGSANKDRLANLYVKFKDSNQTEIAVDEKGEIEVCTSTDEGAMNLQEYMALKNWTLY